MLRFLLSLSVLLCFLLQPLSALAQETLFIFVEAEAGAPAATVTQGTEASEGIDLDGAAAPGATVPPEASGTGPLSYWTAPHGQVDDAALWEIMMQPITVYDGGLDQRSHVYLMENPDGTGKKLAQVHAQSQGIHVLGEPNEHGYVLAGAYSNYDSDYFPDDEETLADAFVKKQGYIKASGLKEIEVMTEHALLIDKLTQRLYIYTNGVRVAELMVSTGLIKEGKPWQETPAGEYITVSHVGPFSTHKYMKSDMAIRINGGILIHEVPYEPLGDGSRKYSGFEALLGQKASAGCIRVQRAKTDEGYNHQWIWDTITSAKPYKVLIWDDAGRQDAP